MRYLLLILLGLANIAQAQLGSFGDFGVMTTIATSGSPVPDILWWKFTDGSGTNITATVGTNGITDCTWVTGKSGSGYALSGNGTSQAAQSVGNVTYGTNVITIAFWAYHKYSDNSLTFLIESGPVTDTISNSFAALKDKPTGKFKVATSGTTGLRAENCNLPALNAWTHYMMVFDQQPTTGKGDLRIYFDGNEQTLTTYVNTKTGTSEFEPKILNVLSRNRTNYWANYSIDDLRIYSGDRSADVSAIMNDPQ